MNTNWQKKHGIVIKDFLNYLNNNTDNYILKGGTSLMMCYNLDRFSEDIDLDSTDKHTIKKIVDDFCKINNYKYRVAKDTDTVKRYMIDYGNELKQKPLKIEISYRQRLIDEERHKKVNNIRVYNIDDLCLMKASAYNSRDKIRDLYDISFICNNYWDELSKQSKTVVRNALEYKGLEQFDYLIRTQKDELIDSDKLASDFLFLYDKLDLLADSEERDIIDSFNSEKKTINHWSKLVDAEIERNNINDTYEKEISDIKKER